MSARASYPETPDGRYFVAKGRLWRKTDPRLDDSTRRAAVKALMQARRAVFQAETEDETRVARERVHDAKCRLGERGPVWWDDDAADEGGRHPKNSTYADWWAGLSEEVRRTGIKGRSGSG